jgi:cytochrome P450 family 6
MFSLLFFLIVLFAIAIIRIKKKYNYWKDRGFLQTETEFPFGSYKGMGTKKTVFQVKDDIYKKYKGKASFVGIYTLLTPNLMLTDPEMIKNIYVKDFKYFNYRGLYYNEEDEPIGKKCVNVLYCF